MNFEGEIGEIDLIARLVELGRDHFTGAIRFESDGIIKIVYFKGGDVLSASTNDRSDSIDEILLRAGKVTREHVKQALAKRKETETLGDALLNLGFITRKELTWARRVQVIGILRSISAWETGSYTIVADYLPKRDEGTVFSLQQIIVELIVTEQDRSKFEKLLASGEAVFQKSAEFDTVYRLLGLNQDAEEIVGHVDGTSTAAEVAAASGKDAFNVYKLLHALSLIGVLTRREKPKATNEVSDAARLDDFASVGVSDAADLWGDPEPEPLFAPSPIEPTVEVPIPAATDDEYDFTAEDAIAPDLSFDDPPSMPPTSDMPTWDAPAITTTPSTLAAAAREEQWGFDEAQIETARRAAVPVRSANATDDMPLIAKQVDDAPRRRSGLLIPLIALAVLAIVGFGAWKWWDAQNASPEPQLTARATARKPLRSQSVAAAAAAPTGTVAPAGATTTSATLISSTAPAGLTVTAAPATLIAGSSTTTTTAANATTNRASGRPAAAVPTRTIASARPGTTASTTTMGSARPAAAVSTATTPGARPATVVSTATAPIATIVSGNRIPPAAATARPSTASTVAPGTRPAPPSAASATTAAGTHIERATTGATITNTGAAPRATAGDDALRAKYDAMAREQAANTAGAFTVQFELVCETASLTKALKSGSNQIWFSPLSYRGKACYRVFWGRFGSHAEALQAVKDVPASLRGGATPVVIRIPRS
jgi:hypothetical protein